MKDYKKVADEIAKLKINEALYSFNVYYSYYLIAQNIFNEELNV
jgi:hypothetical protein